MTVENKRASVKENAKNEGKRERREGRLLCKKIIF